MVGTLIVAAAAGTTAAGVAASFALTAAAFAVNFAVSMIVTRMFGDNPENQQDMGVRQQVPPSSVNAIPIVYGDASMGGTFVDAVLTTDQKTMYYVLAISSISSANAALGTSAGILNYDTTKMYYGDRLITFDGTDLTKVVSLTDEAGNVDTKISGNLYINLYKSSSAGVITSTNGAAAPSTVMGGSDIAVGQRWTGTRQMNNLAFAIVKLVYNRDADTTQLSPITFNISHYPNGASVAKPGDVWLDYITNQEYGGAVGWLPDGSFSASFVDTTCVAPLNTYSDQTISYTPAGGGASVTQARYRINGVLDAGQSVLSNLDRIMSACDSWMTYNAALGQWSVVINKAETTAYAFNDDNIIGEIRVSATDITSSINQVEARFPFKSNRDQAAFVNLETPYALLYPNEPVNKYSITYDLVNDSVQAQYLANRLLEQAREDLIVSFSTTYYGIQVDAGTVVSVTNADYGWTNKLFRVMKVNEASLPDGSLGAKLELNEYNAQVYDDASITQFTPAPNSGLPSVSYFSPLAAPTVTGFPTATIPYIDVQVFIPTTGRVTFGSLFWTTSATPTSTDWKLVTTATTTNNEPVTNGTYYTFANITLNTGTYYFAYNVGNDITTSILSPISAALVWNPVTGAGATGPTGPTGITGATGSGINTATVYLYNKNTTTTPPALFSGTFTYTFATGILSGGTLNGWAQTPPSIAAGEFLFLSLATASSSSATDTIPTAEFSTPEVISGTGTNGTNGANTAIVSLFNKNTSAVTPPTTFSGTFTYTFSTAVLSGGTLNSWSQSVPNLASGEYLWQRQATAFSSAATDTIAATEFSSAVVVGAAGATGATGGSGDSVDIVFKRSATQPATPSPSIGTPATWYSDINSVPAGSDPIWSAIGTNTGTGTNYTWQTPVLIEGQNGTDGLSVAELLIYIRATSTPATPTGGSYNFTTQTLTAPSGWYSYVPTGTDPVYTSRSVASITGTTGIDSVLTWTAPTLSFQNGVTGPTGVTGSTGPTGASITGPTGQTGYQVARPAVYQWGLSTPSISGASTYYWSSGIYAGPGGGWSTTITAAPSAGFILYTATATVTDLATATSTAFSWTTASIVVSGYAGTNGATGPTGGAGVTGPTGGSGASSRIMFARIASNPVPVSGTVTVAGDNRPTGAEGGAVWGAAFNVTWYANDPDPSSNNSLYQADGIYNSSTTSWSTPYISALKVGALSAVSTNTGSLTVSGTLQSNTATISGTTMTGSGGVLYASGNFAFGNSTTNITYNGATITLNGQVVAASNLNVANLQAVSANTGSLTVSGTMTAGTAAISGSTFSGSGVVIYSTGKFGAGNTTNNIVWDNSSLNIKGDISGASNVEITGKLSLTGSGNVISGYSVSQYIYSSATYACIYANNTANAPAATFYTGNSRTIYAQNIATFSGNSAIVGDNLGNGPGVQATSNTGTALIAYSSSGGAFNCQGTMAITSSTLVTNLNANYLQGNLASAFVTSTSGDAYSANRLNGSAGTNVLRFVQGTVSGAATANFVGTNKPGSTSSNVWIEITIDGSTFYIPVWS